MTPRSEQPCSALCTGEKRRLGGHRPSRVATRVSECRAPPLRATLARSGRDQWVECVIPAAPDIYCWDPDEAAFAASAAAP